MALLQRRTNPDNKRIAMLAVDAIAPNPDQPRQHFDPQALQELADSIRLYGILQPLSVRRRAGGRFELVAGERRLRAAKLCGLSEVPCLILDIKRETSCMLSLIENIQRKDLDFWEEAQALDRLMQTYRLSQEEAALKIGKSQSAVANKLRILRLPAQVLDIIRQHGGTERHARALLRLPSHQMQEEVARFVMQERYTVAKTEAYIQSCLDALQPPKPTPKSATKAKKSRPKLLIRDVRFFLNSLNHNLSLIQSAGVNAQCAKVEEEDSILLTIRIPKTAKGNS